MEHMLLMLYPVLGSLGAKGGSWGGMERSPKAGEIPKMRKICTQQSQNWGYLWPTEYTESMENMLLRLYPVLGSLGVEGGPWDVEMQGIFPPNVGISPERDISTHQGVSSGGISGKQNAQNAWRTYS